MLAESDPVDRPATAFDMTCVCDLVKLVRARSPRARPISARMFGWLSGRTA